MEEKLRFYGKQSLQSIMINKKYYTPVLWPLVGTIAGIYSQAVCNFAPLVLIAGLCIVIAILGLALYKRSTLMLKISVTFFTFFLGALLLYTQNAEQAHLARMLANKKVDVIAVVTEKDDWIIQQGFSQHVGSVFRLTASEAYNYRSSEHQHVTFDLLCYCRHTTSLQVSDTVLIKNIVIKPAKNLSRSGNPTYDDYLLKEQVLCAVFTTGSYQLKLISRPLFSLKRWLWTARNDVYLAIRQKLSPSTADYFGLIFLGNKQQASSSELRTKFGYWGLSHYLARSGLHIVLFIMLWTFLFRLVPLHGSIKRCMLVVICIVYDFLSWTSIPFARAYYAFLLMKGGELLYQQINYLHILSIVCLSILLFNPMQLFFLDFQLTFALTFTLVFLSALFSIHKKPVDFKIGRKP